MGRLISGGPFFNPWILVRFAAKYSHALRQLYWLADDEIV